MALKPDPSSRVRVRAAQYLRMSTDHQRYSLEFQTLSNAAYAFERGLDIIRTYTDAGLSGLRLDKRDGLKRLLADALSGAADFSVVLVYDVSRWGRFQDPDEAAHYEFICKQAGVRVEYCAEAFDNDGSMTSTIVKHLKRAMAAEFSRELSQKIVGAKRGLGLQGYWPGGNPSYGLRRCQVDRNGVPQRVLELGEANSLKGNRTVVVAGPSKEVRTVRKIFHLFTATDTSPREIAKQLNHDSVPYWSDEKWTESRVRRVLQNELYVGIRLVGRTQTFLGQVTRRPRADWTRVLAACDPIIEPRIFREANRRTVHKPHHGKEKLLADLRRLWAEKGKLSLAIIRRDPQAASPSTYRYHFGSILKAYALIDYEMTAEQKRVTNQVAPHRPFGSQWNRLVVSDAEILRRLGELLDKAGRLSVQLIEVTPGLPRRETLVRRFGSVERAYALVGYQPRARQRQCFDRQIADPDRQ